MKVLLLGVGMQGKATLHDLVQSREVTKIVAADQSLDSLHSHVEKQAYGSRVQCEPLNAESPDSLTRLLGQHPQVAIDQLPGKFHIPVAQLAVENGCHLVNTSYVVPALKLLDKQARSKGVALLPEFGLDPGIDLVMLGEAVRKFDKVEEIRGYGAGLPVREDANNPLRYKVSWTFEGVLNAYRRPARIISNGRAVSIPAKEIFDADNTHMLDVRNLGLMEAYPNGDVLQFAEDLGMNPSQLRHMGRYTARWPGHCAFWNTFVKLGLLDEIPVILEGCRVERSRYLASALEPLLQYEPGERDLVLVLNKIKGICNGERKQLNVQVVDFLDRETGLSAMSRTVGFTASIGAQMIASGEISARGLLSPMRDVPYESFVKKLGSRNIQVSEEWVDCA